MSVSFYISYVTHEVACIINRSKSNFISNKFVHNASFAEKIMKKKSERPPFSLSTLTPCAQPLERTVRNKMHKCDYKRKLVVFQRAKLVVNKQSWLQTSACSIIQGRRQRGSGGAVAPPSGTPPSPVGDWRLVSSELF